ncbi:MAG: fasciclin domain-containing protein [Acidimicrobiales bacterium]|nr:fasciclin domain-containing protein [Acidimicrobiales bacterium]
MKIAIKFLTSIALFGFLAGAAFVNAAHHEGDEATKKPNIVEVAAGNEDFTTLVAAVQAADLVDVLSSEGPYTVFAPTNEAFAKLPDGTVEMLLLPENKDKLVAILTYHVVAGDVSAAEVVGLTEVTTLQGGTAAVIVTEEGVTIDGAKVLITDLDASNGVVHVIDTVMMPASQ